MLDGLQKSQPLPGVNLDITNYTRKKELGVLRPIKAGDSYAVITKVWDEANWQEGTPRMIPLSLEQIKAQRDVHQKAADDFTAFIDDLEALPDSLT